MSKRTRPGFFRPRPFPAALATLALATAAAPEARAACQVQAVGPRKLGERIGAAHQWSSPLQAPCTISSCAQPECESTGARPAHDSWMNSRAASKR